MALLNEINNMKAALPTREIEPIVEDMEWSQNQVEDKTEDANKEINQDNVDKAEEANIDQLKVLEKYKNSGHTRENPQSEAVKKLQIFKCSQCPIEVDTEENLQKHLNTSHSKPTLKCSQCLIEFDSEET